MANRADFLTSARSLYRRAVPDAVREPIRGLRQLISARAGTARRADGRQRSRRAAKDLRKQQRRIARFKGRFVGERCVVMGNGPSLNEMDLDRFDGEMVWGSNRVYLLYDRLRWRHRFYVAVDKRVVPDIADDISHLIDTMPGTEFFFPYVFREDGVLAEGPNVYWYRERFGRRREGPGGVLATDPTDFLFTVATVTIAAIQLSVYMGFRRIYLIGCDTSYKIPSSVDFEGGDRRLLSSTADDDPNHFDPSYFGKGRKWHDPGVDRMLNDYELVRKACEPMGVEIYNATMGGDLEVFPRVDYRDVFGG